VTQARRVVIDGRMVGPTPHGFARYVSALAEGLGLCRAQMPLKYEPIFLVAAGQAPRAFAGYQTCEVGAKFLSPLEMIELPRVLKRLGAALYHSPTFSSLPRVPCPWVVTVHDLNHLQYGGWREKFYYERLLKPFVRKASAVATVSEFSRKELAEWSGLDLSRIEVAYNAIDPVFRERARPEAIEEVLKHFKLRKGEYFFCLSNPKPHKNLTLLLDAYGGYRQRALLPSLSGNPSAARHWDLAINLAPEGESVPGLIRLGRPTDAQACALMAGAGAVVFPSLYEGFGLPPVEAACLSVPLLVSRIPPHREALADLVQGEVLWVDPKDTAAWTQALLRATAGAVLGASMESRSQLMRRFSAANLGARMDRVYQRVLGIEA
jgi:glycosyltransferase involved in cell wall biosynthesis